MCGPELNHVFVGVCLPIPKCLCDTILSAANVNDPLLLALGRGDAENLVGILGSVVVGTAKWGVVGDLARDTPEGQADFLDFDV